MESENSTAFEKAVNIGLIQPWRTFFFEAALFSLTLTLGILSAVRLMVFRGSHHIPPAQPISPANFIGAFIMATAFILLIPLLIKRRLVKAIIFKIIFVLAVFFGGLLILGLWLPSLWPLVVIVLLIFGWLKIPSIFLHNLSLILAMAGLAATLGLSLRPLMVAGFLVLFSVYDFIAVYKTKHMVKMAKEMIRGGAILGFVAPQKLTDLGASLKEVKPGGRFLVLGGGDVAFPLLLAVSLIPQNLFSALVVALFSLIGLFFSFLLFIRQKERRAIPALPPIALFTLIGYLLTLVPGLI